MKKRILNILRYMIAFIIGAIFIAVSCYFSAWFLFKVIAPIFE